MSTKEFSNYLEALTNYSVCIRPHLENIRDRMEINKVYLNTELSNYCQQERNNVISTKQILSQLGYTKSL